MPAAKGISPKKWGRVTWVMLHGLAHLAIARPNNNKVARAVRLVVLLMPFLLPCRECRTNLAAKLKRFPGPDDEMVRIDAGALARWIHKLHNRTNDATGKPRVGFTEGLDGAMSELLGQSELGERRLRGLVSVATRLATGYILRCLVERKGLAQRSARRAAEYERAAAAYKAFRYLAGVVLDERKNGGVGEKCSSTSSSRSRSRCATRRARRSAGRSRGESGG